MRRHRLDLVAVVFGLVFAVGTITWIAWEHHSIDTHELVLAMPIALIVLGALGVAASLVRPPARGQRQPVPDHEAAGDGADDSGPDDRSDGPDDRSPQTPTERHDR